MSDPWEKQSHTGTSTTTHTGARPKTPKVQRQQQHQSQQHQSQQQQPQQQQHQQQQQQQQQQQPHQQMQQQHHQQKLKQEQRQQLQHQYYHQQLQQQERQQQHHQQQQQQHRQHPQGDHQVQQRQPRSDQPQQYHKQNGSLLQAETTLNRPQRTRSRSPMLKAEHNGASNVVKKVNFEPLYDTPPGSSNKTGSVYGQAKAIPIREDSGIYHQTGIKQTDPIQIYQTPGNKTVTNTDTGIYQTLKTGTGAKRDDPSIYKSTGINQAREEQEIYQSLADTAGNITQNTDYNKTTNESDIYTKSGNTNNRTGTRPKSNTFLGYNCQRKEWIEIDKRTGTVRGLNEKRTGNETVARPGNGARKTVDIQTRKSTRCNDSDWEDGDDERDINDKLRSILAGSIDQVNDDNDSNTSIENASISDRENYSEGSQYNRTANNNRVEYPREQEYSTSTMRRVGQESQRHEGGRVATHTTYMTCNANDIGDGQGNNNDKEDMYQTVSACKSNAMQTTQAQIHSPIGQGIISRRNDQVGSPHKSAFSSPSQQHAGFRNEHYAEPSRRATSVRVSETLQHHPPRVEIIQCSPTIRRRTYHPHTSQEYSEDYLERGSVTIGPGVKIGDGVKIQGQNYPRGYPASTFNPQVLGYPSSPPAVPPKAIQQQQQQEYATLRTRPSKAPAVPLKSLTKQGYVAVSAKDQIKVIVTPPQSPEHEQKSISLQQSPNQNQRMNPNQEHITDQLQIKDRSNLPAPQPSTSQGESDAPDVDPFSDIFEQTLNEASTSEDDPVGALRMRSEFDSMSEIDVRVAALEQQALPGTVQRYQGSTQQQSGVAQCSSAIAKRQESVEEAWPPPPPPQNRPPPENEQIHIFADVSVRPPKPPRKSTYENMQTQFKHVKSESSSSSSASSSQSLKTDDSTHSAHSAHSSYESSAPISSSTPFNSSSTLPISPTSPPMSPGSPSSISSTLTAQEGHQPEENERPRSPRAPGLKQLGHGRHRNQYENVDVPDFNNGGFVDDNGVARNSIVDNSAAMSSNGYNHVPETKRPAQLPSTTSSTSQEETTAFNSTADQILSPQLPLPPHPVTADDHITSMDLPKAPSSGNLQDGLSIHELVSPDLPTPPSPECGVSIGQVTPQFQAPLIRTESHSGPPNSSNSPPNLHPQNCAPNAENNTRGRIPNTLNRFQGNQNQFQEPANHFQENANQFQFQETSDVWKFSEASDVGQFPETPSPRSPRPHQYENVALQDAPEIQNRRSLIRKNQYENVILYADENDEEERNEEDGEECSSDGSYFSGSEFDDTDDDELHELKDLSEEDGSGGGGSSSTDRSSRGSDPLFECVLDLLHTEKIYVDRLHFLCRVVLLNLKVLHNVQDVHGIPPAAWKDIFSNVEEIYALHSGYIVNRLQDRVVHWQTEGQLGDLILDILPRLCVYQHYNVARCMSALSLWVAKSPILAALITEVEKVPECSRLSVKQHMLEIVHRVPKYQAICKDYVKYLAPETEEMDKMKEAIKQLDQLTVNIARGLGQDERMKKLRELEQRLDVSLSLPSPTRELVAEGKMKTIAPQNDKKLERYVFLLTDMLLVCSPPSLGNKHKLKFIMEVEKMQVHDGDNLAVPNTFYVQSRRKAIECVASTHEDKKKWVKVLQKTIDEFTTWRLSSQPRAHKPKQIQDDDLGKVPPPQPAEGETKVCYVCDKKVKSKESQCAACGQVVCAKCVKHKLPLEYDDWRMNKVCDECFIILKTRDLKAEKNWKLEPVAASDPAKVAGFLQMSTNKGKSWSKRWITVHHDGTFYTFKTHKDQHQHGSLPLRRFSVAVAEGMKKGSVFKLYNTRKTYFFQGDRPEAVQGWIHQLADFTDSRA